MLTNPRCHRGHWKLQQFLDNLMENNLKGDTQNRIHYISVGTSEKLTACKCIPYKCVVSKPVSLLLSSGAEGPTDLSGCSHFPMLQRGGDPYVLPMLQFLPAFLLLKKLLTSSAGYFSAVIIFQKPGKVEHGGVCHFLSFPHHFFSP